ncbi:1167_t:CDS:2 [Diversispora eburnea]|uniref:1167_t:CDS:1 n=1 Tax=Diversispora eburnea TaxID=1213867 RepID=A0A9N8ZIY3_9GLOM|nr:1167_t:CDS:2 [Diversispora eburnea]
MLNRTFALTRISKCTDIHHFILYAGYKFDNSIWSNGTLETKTFTIDIYCSTHIQTVGNYRVYYFSSNNANNGREADEMEAYYVLRLPPGTQIMIGAMILYNCHHDNDLGCNFCPWRLFTNSHEDYFRCRKG